jgi:hypothetical protein
MLRKVRQLCVLRSRGRQVPWEALSLQVRQRARD